MVKETVIVLGGGKSAASHDLQNLKSLGYVIGVNDAGLHAPVDCVVTMDRTWFENRWRRVKELGLPLYAREQAVENVPERWDGLNIFENDRHSNRMVMDSHVLNGVNSGYCALNLAYKMKPKQVMILGFDCANTGYWYPAYEWTKWEKPRGITSAWAYERWADALVEVKSQFLKAGIEWI